MLQGQAIFKLSQKMEIQEYELPMLQQQIMEILEEYGLMDIGTKKNGMVKNSVN